MVATEPHQVAVPPARGCGATSAKSNGARDVSNNREETTMSKKSPKKKFFKPPKPIGEMSEDELTAFSRFILESINKNDDEETPDESR